MRERIDRNIIRVQIGTVLYCHCYIRIMLRTIGLKV